MINSGRDFDKRWLVDEIAVTSKRAIPKPAPTCSNCCDDDDDGEDFKAVPTSDPMTTAARIRLLDIRQESLTASSACCYGCHLGCHFARSWRGWMGIEPTQDASTAPADGFEDRGSDLH